MPVLPTHPDTAATTKSNRRARGERREENQQIPANPSAHSAVSAVYRKRAAGLMARGSGMLVAGACLVAVVIPAAAATTTTGARLDHAGARIEVSEDIVLLTKGDTPLMHIEAFEFNYERLDTWRIAGQDATSITLAATLPSSVDYYRPMTDTRERTLEITISTVDGGFRFFAAPEWGRQVGLELRYLGDHFFGLSEPLQPDNRLSPDLTGASIVVDVVSEAASMRENYASAFSSFFMSSVGYGAFFDSFARGEYSFAVNGVNRIHHDTGTLDWYLFVGDTGAEIHRHYFALIGAPKPVPIWGLGPIAWRDQNNGGATEILADIAHFAELEIPLTAWFVDRPYSDGHHAWSKMNFSPAFADPATWIGRIRNEHGLEFMTWVAAATFGDPQFERQLGGRYSYLDLSHPPTARAFQERLQANQYAVGVRGHKIDRSDEVFLEHEQWFDGSPLPERRNRYVWLVAKTIAEGIEAAWGDQHFLFARAAIHRTQPYLSALWGGDPRSTWDGLQGNLANAMRSSYMGFPVWGMDVGGYLGEGRIPEELYIRWLQAGSMAGLFEIKLDGSGGEGRDRLPWRYGEQLQTAFRRICEERMALLPYLYSLATTSATTGVLMQPMAYQHLDDEHTWDIWDQFSLGDAILVAPVVTPGTSRAVYLPAGRWRRYDDPAEVLVGGRTIPVEADLETLPRFIRENSIYVTGSVYAGNSSRWEELDRHLTIWVNPSSADGSYTFTYVDPANEQHLPIRVDRTGDSVHLTAQALGAQPTVRVFLDGAPETVTVNGEERSPAFDAAAARLDIPLAEDVPIDVAIGL